MPKLTNFKSYKKQNTTNNSKQKMFSVLKQIEKCFSIIKVWLWLKKIHEISLLFVGRDA